MQLSADDVLASCCKHAYYIHGALKNIICLVSTVFYELQAAKASGSQSEGRLQDQLKKLQVSIIPERCTISVP